MKKLITLTLAAALTLSLAACGGKKGADSDIDYINNPGALVVGLTQFLAMD